ncbi:MAG TPA: apolipoprotein N-acyltransferase [Actinomycetota bacterium]
MWQVLAGLPASLAAGALSGVATALAFPPHDVGLLAFFSLIPLALVFRAGKGPQVAVAAGVFGLVFFGLLFPWIHLFGTAAYVLLVTLETAFVVVFLVVGLALRRRLPPALTPLAFGTAYLAGEFLRSHTPIGGFPWGGLGYTQHDHAAILRLAAYTGVWGVTLLIAAVNAILAEALVALVSAPGRALRLLALAAALVLAPALLPVSQPNGAPMTLALVQRQPPAQDPAQGSAQEQSLRSEAALTRSVAARKVGLVVWPESSFDNDPLSTASLAGPLLQSIRATGAAFVVGASVDAPGPRFRNESLFIRPDGTLAAQYVKMHLVPFGEYVPGRRFLASWIHELDKVPADGVAGTSPTVFSLPQGKFGTVICYETAYPELVGSFVARGARMIVVSTNNASYRRTPASAQMVAISQLRAAEQRMWVAQSALTGISAVIAPTGQVVERTKLFDSQVLTPTVRFATTRTPYGRYGDWLPAVLFVVALAMTAGGPLRTERTGRAG